VEAGWSNPDHGVMPSVENHVAPGAPS
jgi:hypothetical protein